jgi:hypothetical protein
MQIFRMESVCAYHYVWFYIYHVSMCVTVHLYSLTNACRFSTRMTFQRNHSSSYSAQATDWRLLPTPKRRDQLRGPLRFLFNSYRGSFAGVMRSGREGDITSLWRLSGMNRNNFTQWNRVIPERLTGPQLV